MGLAFATLVGLALALAATGYWGIHTIASTAEEILSVDVVAADTSGQVQAATLNLRRYEKDYFLNMGDPKQRDHYLDEWKSERQILLGLLDKLNAVVDDADRAKIANMRSALDRYDDGFEKVRDAVQAGTVHSPSEANVALIPYKDHIRALEANARIFRGDSLHGVRDDIARQTARSNSVPAGASSGSVASVLLGSSRATAPSRSSVNATARSVASARY